MNCDKSNQSSYEKSFDAMQSQRIYRREHPMTILAVLFMVGLVLLMPLLEKTPSVLQGVVGQTVTVTGTVAESRDGSGYLWLKLDEKQESKKEMVYISLPRDWHNDSAVPVWYPAGTQLKITGMVELPQGQRNPGGFDERRWLLSKQARVKLLAKELSDIQVLEEPRGIWKLSYDAQRMVKQMGEQYLSEEQQNLTLALLLGEKQKLEQPFYRLTQQMGIAHVFAVSGLHVGFIGALLLFVFQRLGWERSWLSFFVMVAGLGFYCMVTGLQPSAIRAALMLLLAALALRLLRPPSAVDFLSLAAIVLLLGNPFLLYTAGFQLSFGVTLSLLLFVQPIRRKLSCMKSGKLRDSLAVVLAACVGSLPLTAWHFYTLSLLSPLYNLLLVPLVSVLVPLLLTAFLFTAFLPAGGVMFFLPVRLLLNMLLCSTNILADWFSAGQWYVGRPDWMAAVCYLLFLFFLWLWLTDNETDKWKSKVYRNRSIGLLLIVILLSIPAAPHSDELLYLDAGQGSSAVLRTDEGETIIFDGGASQRELASYLAWCGVNEVKAIVLSHGDADHITGLAQVLENIPVQHLCVEENQMERAEMQDLLLQAEACGTAVRPISDCARLALVDGEITLEVFSDGGADTNSRELTAVAQLGDRKQTVTIAFPGDLEVRGVEAFVQKQKHIDIWTVPHHGSRYSASGSLYRQLRQKGVQLAVISAGVDNGYGHPHADVLELLREQQIEIYRTDQQGAIRIPLEQITPKYSSNSNKIGKKFANIVDL